MRKSLVFLTFAFSLLIHSLLVPKKHEKVTKPKKTIQHKKSLSIPENSFLGVQLFDSSEKIINKHGSPTLIQSAEPKESEENADTSKHSEQFVHYVKWIYKKINSQYAFTLGKDGHVIRIECLGLYDPQAITQKKVKLGDEFSKVIKFYGSPENYSLIENYSIARYTVNHHLEFKFANTKAGQPLKVVGIALSSSKVIDAKEDSEKKKP